MLIRSQDKKKLIPIMPLGITKLVRSCRGEANRVDGYAIYSYDNVNMILGNYSTEEKAIKVLDMIEAEYLNANHSTMIGNYAFVKNVVFEMPQDSEVEV